jgi:hypothetical protein
VILNEEQLKELRNTNRRELPNAGRCKFFGSMDQPYKHCTDIQNLLDTIDHLRGQKQNFGMDDRPEKLK